MLTPQYMLDLSDEIIIDNFAGGGGASTGIELALGRHVDVAINHDPEAVSMHQANHPQTVHHCESVWEVNPREVLPGRKIGLLWLSPDCFPSGTLVMTDKGYRPIERIRVGDMVLTHKLRWRAVTECSSTVRPLIEIRGHGHPGLRVSQEHPFYTREQFRVWNNDRRTYDHFLHPETWTPASAVDKGIYWAAPHSFPASVAPSVAGRGIDLTDEFLWLAGRYLGDGWTRLTDTRAELVITCGMHEVDRLRDLLNRWPRVGDRSVGNELAWHERQTRTAYQFTTSHRGLVEWLREHFGHRAEAKGVPAWALGLSVSAREALLEGYLSADGHKFEDFVEAHTVSKSLAFGLKALANSLGKTVAVYCRPNSSVIEGREVNARDLFKVRWRHNVHAEHTQTYIENGIEWCPVREQSDIGESSEVFNIGVEEDESYVVEGIIVHNCKHFSKAKGGKPVEKKIRGLAWVALRWVALRKPRRLVLENVEEFVTWGPLVEDEKGNMRPCPKRKGQEFNAFVNALRRHGYVVEWKELRACDFGTPTIRKRLFLIARCDGQPIIWPEPTHFDPKREENRHRERGEKRRPAWRTAAECIDWDIPCPSIFLSKENGRAIGVKRPLADNTLRRVAKGIMRYVVNAAEPFIVTAAHGEGKPGAAQRWGKGHRSMGEPLPTITASGGYALATPFITEHANGSNQRNMPADEPLRTQCAQVKGGHFAVVAPTLIQTGYGERQGQSPRAPGLDKPLGTIVAGGGKHALVSAFMAKHYGGVVGHSLDGEPLHTVTSTDHNSLVTAHIQRDIGKSIGHAAAAPLGTITAGGGGKSALITSNIVKLRGDNIGQPDTEPLHTVSAQGTHFAEVRAFLVKYYGNEQDGIPLNEPIHTVTARDRFGLVTVHGEEYAITDIGLRMLAPRELFRAQGFPEHYIIDRGLHIDADGNQHWKPLTKSAQVRMCGNSVCPPLAAALIRANCADMIANNEEKRRKA